MKNALQQIPYFRWDLLSSFPLKKNKMKHLQELSNNTENHHSFHFRYETFSILKSFLNPPLSGGGLCSFLTKYSKHQYFQLSPFKFTRISFQDYFL